MTTQTASPSLATRQIGTKEFETIRSMMYAQVGIVLQDNKRALVEARVNKRLRALGIDSYDGYLEYLGGPEGGAELIQLIDAISTNVTHFFRENEHFDFTAEVVGQWLAEGRRKLRFWSAACSTGEEPYSLAMTLRSVKGFAQADAKILATDISTRVLKMAAEGRYDSSVVAKIPAPMRKGAFRSLSDGREEVTVDLKRLMMFRRMNLNKTPYPIKGVFDIIFCRNVMIYFDRDLRARIVGEAHRLLQPGGYLIIGHAETLIGMESRFEFVMPSVYRKVG